MFNQNHRLGYQKKTCFTLWDEMSTIKIKRDAQKYNWRSCIFVSASSWIWVKAPFFSERIKVLDPLCICVTWNHEPRPSIGPFFVNVGVEPSRHWWISLCCLYSYLLSARNTSCILLLDVGPNFLATQKRVSFFWQNYCFLFVDTAHVSRQNDYLILARVYQLCSMNSPQSPLTLLPLAGKHRHRPSLY